MDGIISVLTKHQEDKRKEALSQILLQPKVIKVFG